MTLDTALVAPGREILCSRCTAVLAVEQGSQLTVCEYCGTVNHVDKSETVLHYVVHDTVREQDAVAALRRWMGGNMTVKNLDKKAIINPPVFQLWPVWQVRAKVAGLEKVYLKPASPRTVLNMSQMAIPAADLRPFDYTLHANAVKPTVPVNAVRLWMAGNNSVDPAAIKEIVLVHLPMYTFTYTYADRVYTAVVDASTSKVYADLFPSKQEIPYQGIGVAAVILYFFAAILPYLLLPDGVFRPEMYPLFYLAAFAIVTIPVFGLAVYISAKI